WFCASTGSALGAESLRPVRGSCREPARAGPDGRAGLSAPGCWASTPALISAAATAAIRQVVIESPDRLLSLSIRRGASKQSVLCRLTLSCDRDRVHGSRFPVRWFGSLVRGFSRFFGSTFAGSRVPAQRRTSEPGNRTQERGTGNLNPTVALATVGPSIRRVSAVGRGPALVADWKDMKMTP